MNPKVKSNFTNFKDISINEINRSNDHPRRLVAAIENSVSSLDDPETFAGYVLELGRRHARLKFKPSKSQVRIYYYIDYTCEIKAQRRVQS